MNPIPIHTSLLLCLIATEWKDRLAAHMATFLAGPIPAAQAIASSELPLRIDGNVATVPIIGPIEKRASMFGSYYGLASSQQITRAVDTAAADDDVETIQLLIDSPGGAVDGTLEAANAVLRARRTKRVIAQSEGMIASAAYWIASQASEIRAGPMDLIGSLGVRMTLYDWSEAFENAGVKAISIDTGGMKSVGQMGTKITDDQIAYLQGIVDEFGRQFRASITRGRENLTGAQVAKLFDGTVKVAPEARDVGLIDQVKTAAETRAELAGAGRRRAARRARADLTRLAASI